MGVKTQNFFQEVFSDLVNKNIFVNFTVEFIFFLIKLFVCITIYCSVLKLVDKIASIYDSATRFMMKSHDMLKVA